MASSHSLSKDALANPRDSESDLAQAWAEIVKGEKTAQALESRLTSMEKKIEDLLASFPEEQRNMVEESTSNKREASEKAPQK